MAEIRDILPSGLWDKRATREKVKKSLADNFRKAGGEGEPEFIICRCENREHLNRPHYHVVVKTSVSFDERVVKPPPAPRKTARKRGLRGRR